MCLVASNPDHKGKFISNCLLFIRAKLEQLDRLLPRFQAQVMRTG